MVGTAVQRLILWRSINSSTSAGSYLPACTTSVSPTITARSSVCIWPTWNRGPVISAMSCADSSTWCGSFFVTCSVMCRRASTARCDSTTAFGWPDVPDVKMMSAVSSSSCEPSGSFAVLRCAAGMAQGPHRLPAGILGAAWRVGEREDGLDRREAVRNFLGAPPCVREDRDCAGGETAPEIDDPFRAVAAEDEHAIAVRDAEVRELARLGGDRATQLGERDDAIALDDVRTIAPALARTRAGSPRVADAACTSGTGRRAAFRRRSGRPKLPVPMTSVFLLFVPCANVSTE